SSWARAIRRWPMRPQAPLMPMCVFMITPRKVAMPRAASGVHLDGFHNFLQVVADLNGAVGEAGPAHPAVAEYLVERFRIRTVVGHRRGRIFQLMPGQNADHALARFDGAFLAQ